MLLSPTSFSAGLRDDLPQRRPPPGFRPAGRVSRAWKTECPFPSSGRKSGAMKAGLAYEKKVKDLLFRQFNASFCPSQWFCFSNDDDARRYCQTDGLIVQGDQILLVEVKIRWTASAWWQLRELYLPVIRAAFGPKHVALLAVTKTFDPAIHIPEPVEFVEKLQDFEFWSERKVHVHLWSGR